METIHNETAIPIAEPVNTPNATPVISGQNPIKKRGWIKIVPNLILLIIVGVAGIIIGSNFRSEKENNKEPEEEEKKGNHYLSVKLSPERQQFAGIEVSKVQSKLTKQVNWRGGRIELNEDRIAHISPPAEGIIASSNVKLGQQVKAGDILATIDCREFGYLKLELVKAKASLMTEKENFDRITITRANTTELLKLLSEEKSISEIEKLLSDKPIGEYRSQLLSAYTLRNQLQNQLVSQKESQGAVPESVIRKTSSELEAAQAAYLSAFEEIRFQVQHQTKQAQLKLREAQTMVDITKAKLLTFGLSPSEIENIDPLAEGPKSSILNVRAPFAGTIIEKHAVLSERVSPMFQMFVLADLDNLWIQTDLFEVDIPMINSLKSNQILYRTKYDEKQGTAQIISKGDVIDKNSKALTLTAEVKNTDRKLKPRMFVEVGFETEEEKPVIQVPISSVYRFENQPFVFIKKESELFLRVDVRLGKEFGGMVEILDGLSGDEVIVTKGGYILKSELLKDQMVGE
ncbi:MAG: efflux RND transporter periplasmic adaptor subunit [Gemmataceae bacterium]|jgi:multidrug efflux pump subunit AcrA (membrane-fusion protein)|nr:efflux RND transporter periplasmic adaptor subunit [Gemmataceae bacterium]